LEPQLPLGGTDDPGAPGEWDTSTLHERICDELRRRMMSGSLPPGTRIPEARLASELNVSRGTMREALRQLRRERLITWEPRRSPHVRRMTTSEIEDIYEVRELLEGGAARTLAALRPRDRARAVAALRAAYEDLRAAHAESVAARIDAELRFHQTICALCGNELLLQLWQDLRPVIQLMLHCLPESVLADLSVEDHLELIDAIEEGDPAEAVNVIAAQFSGAPALLSPYASTRPPVRGGRAGRPRPAVQHR
jgi:DNA-binding GntR family transcriptional regulator